MKKKLLITGLCVLSLMSYAGTVSAIGLGGIAKTAKKGAEVAQKLNITVEDEKAYGNAMHPYLVSDFGGEHRNKAVQKYVSAIGHNLVPKDSKFDFTFTVINTDMVNAFAMPGGYVYITRGILKSMKNEAQLAAVLGHEIQHVIGRHGKEQLQKAVLAEEGVNLAGSAAGKAGGAIGKDLAKKLAGVFKDLAMAGYGRSQESESDLRGTDYSYQAGYNPNGGVEFFEILFQMQGGVDRGGAYATHPKTKDRINKLSKYIKKKKYSGGKTNEQAFLTMQKKV
ncbi:MAG: M48 family metalloprotease [Deltaproteobacteria bacterium]|nr:M48 family metalloprotease [Deltaproteobacteria bacterium]